MNKERQKHISRSRIKCVFFFVLDFTKNRLKSMEMAGELSKVVQFLNNCGFLSNAVFEYCGYSV